MPFSDNSNIEWTRWLISELKPASVIDVGPGAGKYGTIIKEFDSQTHTTGVEIWAPYIEEFQLSKIYDTIHVCDARIYPSYVADLVILGDVLEHMGRDEALILWNKIRSEAKAALISIPVIHFPQGPEFGNPYEEHVEDHWTHDDVMLFFPGITGYREFGVTASYIADFSKKQEEV